MFYLAVLRLHLRLDVRVAHEREARGEAERGHEREREPRGVPVDALDERGICGDHRIHGGDFGAEAPLEPHGFSRDISGSSPDARPVATGFFVRGISVQNIFSQ